MLKKEVTVAEEEEKSGNVRAVLRAVDVLKCFEDAEQPLSVTEIRRRVPLSRPTLYRLLETLVAAEMLHVEGEPQRFRLGRMVAVLGRSWANNVRADAVAKPVLEELRDKSGETSALFELRGGRQFCIAEVRSRHALAMSRGIGELSDGFHGASGIAILAWLDLPDAMRLASETLLPGVPPITEIDLKLAREAGCAVSHGAIFTGAASIAAPVFRQDGSVFGSLGVFGPDARITSEVIADIANEVKFAAQKLSKELGAPLGN